MPPTPEFLPEAQRRLDDFYCSLSQSGEVAPGPRFQLEGFLEAGLYLGLVQHQPLQALIDASYRAYMGQGPQPLPGRDQAVQLPVLWQRAPVYAPGEGGPK